MGAKRVNDEMSYSLPECRIKARKTRLYIRCVRLCRTNWSFLAKLWLVMQNEEIKSESSDAVSNQLGSFSSIFHVQKSEFEQE